MAISKKGSKYCVTVSVRPANGGHPINKQVTITGTLADAKLAEADLYRELRARSLTTAFASTFGDAVDLFVKNRRERGKMSPSYEQMISFVRRELGDVRLETFVDRFDVYRKHLMRSPTAQGKPRGSASTNRYTTIVRAVFNHLVALEVLPKNPITRVRFPNLEEQSRDRVLTQEERLRLRTAICEYRPYAWPIIRYMLAVPCRTGELLGAGREQYSLTTNTIFIPESKAGVSIYKPVPPHMTTYFQTIPDNCPWLFYRQVDGEYKPMTRQVLRRAWEDSLRRAGLVDYHLHDLRHEAVTDLYDMGNKELDIAAVCGWVPKIQPLIPMLPRYKHTEKVAAAQRIVFKPEYSAAPVVEVGGVVAAR